MNAWAHAEKIWSNLIALGTRRLATLGIMGLSVAALVMFGGLYLSRPNSEVLYSGLDRDDVSGIGTALKEAGIPFDVNAEGNSVLVPVGQASVARMTLAEKGLPRSGTVGNELFDKLGSLGLTSFMQDVTRIRAKEGELGRTIQMMRGIKAARVHLVLGDEGSFRREKQAPSASVVVRTDGNDTRATGDAIRHLVAAAVPNMTLDEVTVLDVDGRLLAAGNDSIDKAPDNLLALQKAVDQDVRDRITLTLAPYLNPRNFQVSVAARLNADRRQTSETIFDPESRVERSVRVVKEKQVSQNAAGQQAAGVQANLPKPKTSDAETRSASDDSQKNEELTNYEISSKQVQTTSAGYTVDGLSVAVLINRSALAASLGDRPDPEAVGKQIEEIQQLVASAAGTRKERGDVVKISVVDFVDTGRDFGPVPGPSIGERLLAQSGTLFNAGAIIAVAFLLIFFGLRPAAKALLTPVATAAQALPALPAESPVMSLPRHSTADNPPAVDRDMDEDEASSSVLGRKDRLLQRGLMELVEYDEKHVVAILKEWMREGVQA